MAFASFDVFPFIVAVLPSQFCGLDALTVDAARRRVLVTARLAILAKIMPNHPITDFVCHFN
jgi:hypothetical protein